MRFNPAEPQDRSGMGRQRRDSRLPRDLATRGSNHQLLAVHPFRIPDLREALSVLTLTFSQMRDAVTLLYPSTSQKRSADDELHWLDSKRNTPMESAPRWRW